MKLTKIVLTGVIAAAMMSTSCSSDSNDDMAGDDASNDTVHMNHSDEHPSDSEHPAGDDSNEEHPSDATHADGVHESSAVIKHEEVKLTLLPPAITEALKQEEYLDYKVEKAFVIKENDVKTYEIRVKKAGVQSKMLFNEKGIRLDK